MKRVLVLLILVAGLIALVSWMPRADALESFYAANCTACHSSTVTTCNGCHAHGVHSSSAKDDINVTGVTDKSTYAPGETVTVTITGGYRIGWIRAILYDDTMTELARVSCPGGQGGCTESVYPVTLTAPAPSTPGTYTWNVSWYGNQTDIEGALFQPTCSETLTMNCWSPDPNNPNHGQEIVSTNSFTVKIGPEADINLDPAMLDFGTVNIGDAPTLTTQVQNVGDADLEVINIALCTGTSTEFTWQPITLPFTVAPGSSQTLSATYTPIDTGIDTGCIEITSNDPDEATVQLQVAGKTPTPTVETECFDGVDNDGDGAIDCADSDCAAAVNGVCDTGLLGVCAAGTTQCQDGAAVCVPDTQPTSEKIASDNCADGLDNDCDGLIDADDPSCVLPLPEAGDVGLLKLVDPKQIVIANKSKTGRRVINVLAKAIGASEEVLATVTLTAKAGAGIMVTIDPASISKEIEVSEEGEIEAERFGFKATIVCIEKGAWGVNWTATISAAENSNPENDTLTGTSKVICESPYGKGKTESQGQKRK